MAAGDKNPVQGGNPAEPISAYEDSAADRVQAFLPTDSLGAPITATNPLVTKGQNVTETTGTLTASGQAVTTTVLSDETTATFETSGTFTGSSVLTPEASYDGGTTWYAVPINPKDSANPSLQATATASLHALGLKVWVANIASASHFRVRCSAFQSGDSIGVRVRTSRLQLVVLTQNVPIVGSVAGGAAPTAPPVYIAGYDGSSIRPINVTTKGSAASGTPYFVGIQKANEVGRTAQTYTAVAAAAGTSTTETALTLTKSSGTSATSTGTSFTPTSGKRFRITHIQLGTRGHATATIQTTTFNLRINTGGAVTTSSTPIIFSARTATPATASAWDRAFFDLGGDGYEIAGDGTLQWGITTNSTYTTNAPTLDVAIFGFEY